MKNLGLRAAAAAAALLFTTGAAQAALVNRGGGMIYDTTLDITWLADMSYAFTSGHSGVGVETQFGVTLMTWAAAGNWANNLVYGGYDDWRLPTLNPFDTTCSHNFNPGGGFPLQYSGYHCSGGEMSHLFVADLGNKEGEAVWDQSGDTAEQIANLALFSNVLNVGYWSGTEYAPDASKAFFFATLLGLQNVGFKLGILTALAVRPGDVAPVPEPQTLALAWLALGAMVLARRRRPA